MDLEWGQTWEDARGMETPPPLPDTASGAAAMQDLDDVDELLQLDSNAVMQELPPAPPQTLVTLQPTRIPVNAAAATANLVNPSADAVRILRTPTPPPVVHPDAPAPFRPNGLIPVIVAPEPRPLPRTTFASPSPEPPTVWSVQQMIRNMSTSEQAKCVSAFWMNAKGEATDSFAKSTTVRRLVKAWARKADAAIVKSTLDARGDITEDFLNLWLKKANLRQIAQLVNDRPRSGGFLDARAVVQWAEKTSVVAVVDVMCSRKSTRNMFKAFLTKLGRPLTTPEVSGALSEDPLPVQVRDGVIASLSPRHVADAVRRHPRAAEILELLKPSSATGGVARSRPKKAPKARVDEERVAHQIIRVLAGIVGKERDVPTARG